MFEYEVALSFAGEQRPDVSEVAGCLKAEGVSVFYDEYEKATLWGKNLYDHLSDVYQNKAKYCVIFASKEYAEKTWTNLERQTAQARALDNKGVEYILPVRFDSTVIPGLLPTIGYLDFKREGAQGICSALLAKLGNRHKTVAVSEDATLRCSLSPRALLRLRDGTLAAPLMESCVWGDKIAISVQGSDDDSFFAKLRQERPEVVAAYAFDVAAAQVTGATRQVIKGEVAWNLEFALRQTDFKISWKPVPAAPVRMSLLACGSNACSSTNIDIGRCLRATPSGK
jgi:hypothetical protein